MVSRKIHLPVLWLFCLCTTLNSGCGEKNPAGPDKLNRTGFPLKVGNEWVYKVIGDFQVNGLEFHEEIRATWRVTKIETVFGYEAFRMETTHAFLDGPSRGQSATGIAWYSVKNDTLLAVAAQDAGNLSPLGQLFKPITVTQASAERWNVRVLVFPLALDRKWEFQVDRFFFTKDEKSVEAIDRVSTSAGSFEAFRVVRSAESPSAQLRTMQWFASVGMVKMEHQDELVQSRMDERGNVIGESKSSTMEVMELESFHLAPE
jgi:hypothetical protein